MDGSFVWGSQRRKLSRYGAPHPPGTQHLTCILTPQNNPTRAHSIALLQVTEVRAALHGREGFLLLIDNKSKICAAVQIESFFQLGLFCLKKNVM